MTSVKDQAEFQRLALVMGLTDIDAVVAWAERFIEASAEPPIEIIDISLAGNRYRDEMASLLSRVRGEADLTTIAHRVLAHFLQQFRSGYITLNDAVKMLAVYHGWSFVPEVEYMACAFEEILFCIEHEGYPRSLEWLRDEIIAFASKYAEAPPL